MKNNGKSDASVISSIIGADARLLGSFNVEGSLRIDGTVEGHVSSAATVTVGVNATINGNIIAEEVIMGGIINGCVVARSRLVLESSARLEGDLAATRLIISEGATFNGHCGMGESFVSKLTERLESERSEKVTAQGQYLFSTNSESGQDSAPESSLSK